MIGADYQPVSTGEDMAQINPLFDAEKMESLFGEMSSGRTSLMNLLGGGGAQGGIEQFLGLAPKLQELTMGATSPFAQAQLGLAETMSQQAIREIEAQHAGPLGGSVRSGGFLEDILQKGIGVPYGQAISNITGQQTGMLQNLLGTALGSLPGLGVQQQGIGASALPQMFGAEVGMREPTFYEPQYYDVNAPNRELWGSILGMGIPALTSLIPGVGPALAGLMALRSNPNFGVR